MRRTNLTTTLAAIAVVLSGCSLLFGGPNGGPPLASINGVPGQLGSYCWDSTCGDSGFPDPLTLPTVSAPLTLAAPLNADTIEIYAYGPGGQDANPIEVGLTDGVIDPIPPDTVMLTVGVWFAGMGGDAFYSWAIEEPADGVPGEASPTP